MAMSSYRFDILKYAEALDDFDPAVLDERPFVRRALRASTSDSRHEYESEFYVPSPQLAIAINTAIAAGLPLLLTGEPGTGKTQAAWFIARRLKLGRVIEFQVRSTTNARDLLYHFESVRFMAESLRVGGNATPSPEKYVIERPLWEAFTAPSPRVLLIDEIDKAPRDFPNDLLAELDQWRFQVEEVPGKAIAAPANRRPIVVITSNGERTLPDPFLRRCVYCDIELTEKMVHDALRARLAVGEINLPETIAFAAAKQMFEWRQHGLQKKPALAELLVWLGVLEIQCVTQLPANPADIPGTEVLIKTREDRDALGLRS
jgi:MoxR-like ATPase